MPSKIETTMFIPGGWKDVMRAVALGVFILAHMQDVSPILCPLSLGLVGIAFLSDVIWYKRWPIAFLPVIVFTLYLAALFFIHHNYADGTARTLFFTSGRYVYMFFVFISFAHLRPTARFEPLLFNACLVVVGLLCILCLYSLLVSPLTVGAASLSTKGFVTGMLGANGDSGAAISATGKTLSRTSKNAMALALGSVLSMVAAAYLHAFRRERPRCINRLTPWLLVPVLVSFVMTKSRGCMLALSGVMAVVSVSVVRRNPRWQSLLVCGAILFVIAAGVAVETRKSTSSEDNIWARFELWQRAMTIFVRSPIIGVGIGSFEQVDVRYQTLIPYLVTIRASGSIASGDYHGGSGAGASALNSYIQLLLDFGVLGFALYFAWIWQAIKLGREVSHPAGALDDDCELLRQHAKWNSTVINLTCVFIGIQAMTETCVLMGPNGLMIFAASFGRLVAQTEVLRSWNRPQEGPA